MKGTLVVLTTIFLLLAGFVAIPLVPRAHAATGTLCLIQDGATSCGSGGVLSGTPGSQLRVSVFVQGSDGLSGFDITLIADHTVLKPAGADLAGTILQAPQTILLECLGGVLAKGSQCSPADTIDTLRFAAINCSGCALTIAPTTGLLFTAVYNVTKAATGVSLGFQSTTISNGSGSPDPETLQGATFSGGTTPDFAMTASPSTITLAAGFSSTSILSVTSVNGFTDIVNLTSIVSPSGPTVSLSPTSISLSANQTVTSVIQVSTSPSTLPMTYTVVVTGSGAILSHSTTLTVTVSSPPGPDFAMSANPPDLVIAAGFSNTTTINLTSMNGFQGTVNLGASISPSGPSISLNPASIVLSTGGTGTSSLTVSTATSTQAGSYMVSVSASSGTVSHLITIPVRIESTQPDFTLSANPASITISPGMSGTSTIHSQALNGFNGTLTLTVSSTNGLTASVNPSSIGPAGSAVLTVTSSVAGSYTAQVTGTSGSLTHTVAIAVTVATSGPGVVCIIPAGATACPFAPATITGTQGSQLRVSVFIQGSNAINGFDITLLASHGILTPAGADLTGSILPNPQPVLECLSGILVKGNACLPTDSIDALHFAATACPGCLSTATTGLLFTAIYNVTSATSGASIGFQNGCTPTSVSPNVCVAIVNGTPTLLVETVQTAIFSTGTTSDFVLGANPNSITMTTGSSVTSILSITSLNNFLGTVSLTATVSPGGPIVTVSPASITLSANQTLTSTITISTSSSTTPGSYQITITGTSASLSHTVTITVMINAPPQPDFSITSGVSAVTLTQGSSFTTSVTLTSLNGFVGTVRLAFSVSPSGLSISLNPSTLSLSSGGSANSTLTISSTSTTTTGTYQLFVSGSSGSIGHGVNVTIMVNASSTGDFSISASPTSLALLLGTSGTSTITITSINGFSGTVNLAIAHSVGIGAVVNPTSISGSGTATLSIGANFTGTFFVQVTGSSGSLSHSTTVAVSVTGTPDFTLTATPTNQTIARGTSATFTITIRGLNGFNGTVSLSATVSPAAKNGPKISLPTSVGPYSTSTLSASTVHRTPVGTYTITVTATSGSITHMVTIILTVTR